VDFDRRGIILQLIVEKPHALLVRYGLREGAVNGGALDDAVATAAITQNLIRLGL
jgi:hypothetical protein